MISKVSNTFVTQTIGTNIKSLYINKKCYIFEICSGRDLTAITTTITTMAAGKGGPKRVNLAMRDEHIKNTHNIKLRGTTASCCLEKAGKRLVVVYRVLNLLVVFEN